MNGHGRGLNGHGRGLNGHGRGQTPDVLAGDMARV